MTTDEFVEQFRKKCKAKSPGMPAPELDAFLCAARASFDCGQANGHLIRPKAERFLRKAPRKWKNPTRIYAEIYAMNNFLPLADAVAQKTMDLYERALANVREREQNLLQQVEQLQKINALLQEKVDILQKHFDANP